MDHIAIRLSPPVLLAACLLVGYPDSIPEKTPTAMVMILDHQMPKFVNGELPFFNNDYHQHKSIAIYHKLKTEFGLSHTQLAAWLGLKRRSLYNWLDDPDSSRKNKEIEYRLSNLDALSIDMDNEHKPLLFKIAFSPIDGDIKFGEALIRGASKGELLSFYN